MWHESGWVCVVSAGHCVNCIHSSCRQSLTVVTMNFGVLVGDFVQCYLFSCIKTEKQKKLLICALPFWAFSISLASSANLSPSNDLKVAVSQYLLRTPLCVVSKWNHLVSVNTMSRHTYSGRQFFLDRRGPFRSFVETPDRPFLFCLPVQILSTFHVLVLAYYIE